MTKRTLFGLTLASRAMAFTLAASILFAQTTKPSMAASGAEAPPPRQRVAIAGLPPVPVSGPITRGLRVFMMGNSFHVHLYWFNLLRDMSKAAGLEGYQSVGTSYPPYAGLRPLWGFPDNKNNEKVSDAVKAYLNAGAALRDGKADVVTTLSAPKPDEGLDAIAELGLQANPNLRITVQESWQGSDRWGGRGPKEPYETPLGFDTATVAMLHEVHDPYFKVCDDYVIALNKNLGKQVVFVVPSGQALIALREKVIAGQVPGYAKQSDLFKDGHGHSKAPVVVLNGYCHFAVLYRRSPVGLAVPSYFSDPKFGVEAKYREAVNRLLQEIAWDAVIHHPLSGVKGNGVTLPSPGR